MAISDELQTQILRYHHVEKWPVGTISRHLRVHHTTVKRVLAQTGIERKKFVRCKSIIDDYLGFILEKLQQYPTLTAKRLYDMVCTRGYRGGSDHFRHMIALYRPRKMPEAYLRLRTLPGEQSQVDWGHFGHMMVGQAKRSVSGFVMVLSYSRKIFLHFYFDQRLSNFLDGHERAFKAFGGIPKVLLYDNLKNAVLERQGDAIRFHPTLLEMAAYYHFEPRPVAVARGNEKGRVERAIRYIRGNFFAGRQWQDIDDLNHQAEQWCNGLAADRPCPEDKTKTVATVFFEEQPCLMPVPVNPYPTAEQRAVKVGKTPYVRFDLNDYSVPYTSVCSTVMVKATTTEVAVFDGMNEIARHTRSYNKGAQIENAAHIEALVQQKKEAKQHSHQEYLIQAVPSIQQFLVQAAIHQYSLKRVSSDLMSLLKDYGATELEMAVQDALAKKSPHPNTVQIYLQTRRERKNQPPSVSMPVSKDKRVQNQVIKTHQLVNYDELQSTTEEA